MLSFVIVFAATTTLIPICEVHSAPQFVRDIENIIEVFNSQKQQDRTSKRENWDDTKNSGGASTNSDEFDKPYNYLKNAEVIDLLRTFNQKGTNYISNNEEDITKSEDNGKIKYFKENNKVYSAEKADHHNDLLLSQINLLLSVDDQNRNEKNSGASEKLPLNLKVSSVANINQKRNNILDNMSDYSKIYIILDPQALHQSGSKQNLNQLVPKILSLLPSYNQKRNYDTSEYNGYKRFQLKDNVISRRARPDRRDSKELYVERDSAEEDYKQKRPRSEFMGSGGRTSIPYIRHRGDIYEKDD